MGGYGNMIGAIVGGILLGLTETFVAGYLSSAYKDMIAYALLLLFLFVKPVHTFFNTRLTCNCVGGFYTVCLQRCFQSTDQF